MISKDQDEEIAASRGQLCKTRRATVPALEAVMYQAAPVLNHGFVRVIDYMGDDAAIVQAARVSYGSGTKTPSDDAKLISYLMGHGHTTPFEMCEIKFHVKLPIFVARQWIRHRTASVNEYSARYSILDKEFYIPEPGDLELQDSDNKQGRGAVMMERDQRQIWSWLSDGAEVDYDYYESMLELGLSREVARIGLPVNIYTQWYWKVNLHNLFNFLRLRADSHAQKEIQVYAKVMIALARRWVPMAVAAWEDQVIGGCRLNARELAFVKRLGKGTEQSRSDARRLLLGVTDDGVSTKTGRTEFGLSKREWKELREKLL